MPKIKTKKSVSKRFKVTPRKKILRRASTQNHFNARNRGVETLAKRRDKTISPADRKDIKRLMPYH